MFYWPHYYAVATTTLDPDAFSGIYHGFSIGGFSLSDWSLPMIDMSYDNVSYGVCFLFSGSHVAAMFTNVGSIIGVCSTTTLFEYTIGSDIHLLVMVCCPCQEWTEWILLLLPCYCYSFSCTPAIKSIQ